MASASLLTEQERLDLLLDLLRQDHKFEEITLLRLDLLGDLSALEGVLVAASRRQVLPAVIDILTTKGILPIRMPGNRVAGSMLAKLKEADGHFTKRRELLASALHELVVELNTRGIEPLILKGSVSLVTGRPAWRYQRDIDFAVAFAEAGRVVSALHELGYRQCDGAHARPHHLPPMERDELPATLEPHVRLAGARARSALPDEVLLATARRQMWNGVGLRRLSDAGLVLHGLAHHHFQNRGYLFGTFSLKGLLEFAAGLTELDEAGVDECLDIGRDLPRLQAGFRLWCGLAETLLGMKLPAQLAPDHATQAMASATAERFVKGQTAWPIKAALEHIRMMAGCKPGIRISPVLFHPMMEAGHTAVWFDHKNQRRNASGILQEF